MTAEFGWKALLTTNGYPDIGIIYTPDSAALFPQVDSGEAKRLGYVNRQKVWVFPPQYIHNDYDREQFTDGVAFPQQWHSACNLFLTEDGEESVLCIQNVHMSPAGFQDGRLRVWKEDKSESDGTAGGQIRFQFLTHDNQLLQNGQTFRNARDFSEGLAAVRQESLWGYIDANGKIAIDFQYTQAGDFHNGQAAVSDKAGNIFYVDKSGAPMSAPIPGYQFTGDAWSGLFKVRLPAGGYALVNENGQVVSAQTANYEWKGCAWCADLNEGEHGGEAVVVLPNGINLYSDDYFRFFGSVCIGSKNGKDVLYCIETGEKLKTADSIGIFREGLALCRDGFQYGYIDKRGQWQIASPQLKPIYGRSMLEIDNQFYGGLVCANYKYCNVMLYNPLLYPNGWEADEWRRALSWGFGGDEWSDERLTTQELFTLIDGFQSFVQSHVEDGVFSCVPNFRLPQEYISQELNQPISKEQLAVVLCRLAEDMGQPTRHYVGFYADQDVITYQEEVNYTASLGLFDVENNTFQPKEILSQQEAAVIFLRFTEAML